MNILMIGTTDNRGGAARVSMSLKDYFEQGGHSVDMFVADKLGDDKKVKVIPRNKILKIIGFLLGTERFIKTDWIINTPEFRQADIVHCHNLHGRFFNLKTLAKMSKLKPVVWTLHDEWAVTPHCAFTFEGKKMKRGFYVCPSKNIPPRLLWHSEKFMMDDKEKAYRTANFTIVTPSKWLKNKLQVSVLKNKRVELIYNGIDAKVFVKLNKKIIRSKLNLPQDKKIVLFLADGGKSNPWKGWQYTKDVIEKMGEREDLLFVCAGNHAVDKQKEDNIIYLPEIRDMEIMSEYYNAADVLLYSSIADNFPLVILEAMACGLPIVSFDVGGVQEVLAHKENGFIARYKDSDDLCKGLNYIFSLSRGEIELMSNRSISKINNSFDLSTMNSAYHKLYNELIISYEK